MWEEDILEHEAFGVLVIQPSYSLRPIKHQSGADMFRDMGMTIDKESL